MLKCGLKRKPDILKPSEIAPFLDSELNIRNDRKPG